MHIKISINLKLRCNVVGYMKLPPVRNFSRNCNLSLKMLKSSTLLENTLRFKEYAM